MGDYSRDPDAQLSDALSRQYVAVRMQQGVPVLDADWNVLDGIRRAELEAVGTWSIGSGTPVGSNAFAIVPIAGGGIGTIVLESNSPTIGTSTVSVDVGASTAANAVGFTNANSSAERFGSSPARITGHAAEPFTLVDGSTLVVQVNDQAAESVTFNAGDFADITAATAAEMVAVIAAAAPTVTATAGDGNDFIIRSGGGSPGRAGRILVDGQMTIIEADIKYSEQQLFNNAALAAAWDVDVVAPLTTPPATEAYAVYLDIWNREVASREDEDLIDVRIGMETAIRLRREWAVRVAREADYANIVAAIPAGHTYYRLALLQRQAGNNLLDGAMITDERITDLSLRREVAYAGTGDVTLVDTQDFIDLLTQTRNVTRDFIMFLTGQFVDPNDAYVAGEVMGIDALSAIANVAEQGLVLLSARSMGTQDALLFFRQLQEAEARFVTVWTDSVLPLNKPGGQIYDTSFAPMIGRINEYLAGPAPATFTTIPEALDAGNLDQAVRSQQRINTEFGRELDRPVGFLTLTYLGSPVPTILQNQSFDLRYEVSGSVTPDDDIDVEVFIDPQWPTTLRNSDGSIPFDLRMGSGVDNDEFIISVQAPNVSNATTTITLLVSARNNSGGLSHISTQKTLTIGNPPPVSEEAFVISILSTNLTQVAGVFQYPPSVPGGVANMNFQMTNNTNASLTVDLTPDPDPATPPAGWTIFAPPPQELTGVVVPSLGTSNVSFGFLRPPANGNILNFSLTATETATTNVVGEMHISIETVAG